MSIWLYYEMGLWGLWMFGLLYVFVVGMPFIDWVGREEAARYKRNSDKKSNMYRRRFDN